VTPARTRAQRAVLAALTSESAFVSAQELHARLRAAGDTVGLTSVYRAVAQLLEAGAVDAVRSPTGEVTYRACMTDDHHHHLLCRSCGTAVEVEAPPIERWVDQVAREHGFSVVGHVLEVTGLCPRCRGVVSSGHDD
jgi:Fur family ferric uptake transcriptional regulator